MSVAMQKPISVLLHHHPRSLSISSHPTPGLLTLSRPAPRPRSLIRRQPPQHTPAVKPTVAQPRRILQPESHPKRQRSPPPTATTETAPITTTTTAPPVSPKLARNRRARNKSTTAIPANPLSTLTTSAPSEPAPPSASPAHGVPTPTIAAPPPPVTGTPAKRAVSPVISKSAPPLSTPPRRAPASSPTTAPPRGRRARTQSISSILPLPEWDMPAVDAAAKAEQTRSLDSKRGMNIAALTRSESPSPARRRTKTAPVPLLPAADIGKSEQTAPVASELTWQQTLSSMGPRTAPLTSSASDSFFPISSSLPPSTPLRGRTSVSNPNTPPYAQNSQGSQSDSALRRPVLASHGRGHVRSPSFPTAQMAQLALLAANADVSGDAKTTWYAGPKFNNSPDARDLPPPMLIRRGF